MSPKKVFKSQLVPTVCCRDANAHNAVWYSELPPDTRSTACEAISESTLVVPIEYRQARRALNGNEKQSCPDNTAATEDTAICASWNILDNQLSNHYPLLVTVFAQTLPHGKEKQNKT